MKIKPFVFLSVIFVFDNVSAREPTNAKLFEVAEYCLNHGANPNIIVGQQKDPLLMFSIKKIAKEKKREVLPADKEVKRFLVGFLLFLPQLLQILTDESLQLPSISNSSTIVGGVVDILGQLVFISVFLSIPIGVFEMLQAALNLTILKQYQESLRTRRIGSIKKVIEKLLEHKRLELNAKNGEGKTAFDLLDNYEVDASLACLVRDIRRLLLDRRNQGEKA